MANRAEMMDTENRLFNFYLKRSFTPGEALSMAKQEMERRAEEEVRNQQFYQKNPRDLDSTRSELPNYSETANELPARDRVQFDPVTGSVVMPSAPATRYSTPSGNNIVRFSNPMTEEETNIARESLPIPRPGNAQDYGERPSANQPGIIDRALLAVGLPTHVRIPSFGGASAASPAQRYAESTMREDQGEAPPAAATTTSAVAARGNLPLMARPDSGAASTPFNIGQAGPGGLRFGSPTTGELGNMPTSLRNYETRFSMDPRASTLPAASTAAVRREPPAPPRRPEEFARSEPSSFLSRLFSGTNNPVSTRELFNRSEANPDDSGAYMRAERQYAATHKDAPSVDLSKLDSDTGMNRGGIAKAGNTGGGKDAALHKALEIIHHLLTRGR